MFGRGPAAGVPTLPVDLYSRETLLKPVQTYRRIRDAGAVVWLPKNRLWVMGRYRDVRQALGDDQTYCSGDGVAANPVTNILASGTTLTSDGESSRQTSPCTVAIPFRQSTFRS